MTVAEEKPTFRIGDDDFESLIHRSTVFVDKTMLLKELIENSYSTILITRPRRWGKSINMSMMQKFFEVEVDREGNILPEEQKRNRKLFVGGEIDLGLDGFKNFKPLKISHDEFSMKKQGNHPVISVGFKDVKADNYQEIEEAIRYIVLKEFYYHSRYLISHVEDDKLWLSDDEKEKFLRCHKGKASIGEVKTCFRLLSEILYKYFGHKTYIFIDEYDTPINHAYLKFGKDSEDFHKVLELFRGVFGSCLKTNQFLEKGVIIGILRIAKSNVFSDLNNVGEYCLLDEAFSKYYGFLEEEVDELFHKSGLDTERDHIKQWYNGYAFGGELIYNPWSIMNCLDRKGVLQPYWVDSGGTSLIDKALVSDEIQADIQALNSGKSIMSPIFKDIDFSQIESQAGLYSFMLFTGYLNPKVVNPEEDFYELSVPNKEVSRIYRDRLVQWVTSKLHTDLAKYYHFVSLLPVGKLEQFKEKFQNYLLNSASYLQTGPASAELFYSGFMASMLSMLVATYDIEHERESGNCRTDALAIPRPAQRGHTALILEYKVGKTPEELKSLAVFGLKQIGTKYYEQRARTYPQVKKIIKICFAFCGKDMDMEWEIIEV